MNSLEKVESVDDPSFIYLDNNIFGYISSSYDVYSKFYHEAADKLGLHLEKCSPVISPFLVREALGIKISGIQPISTPQSLVTKLENELKKEADGVENIYPKIMGDLKDKLYSEYYAKIEDLEIFSLENLNKALENRISYIEPRLKDFYREHFADNFQTQDDVRLMVGWFALDRIQAHNVRGDFESQYCHALMVDVGAFFHDNRNNPFGRAVSRIWNDFYNDLESRYQEITGKSVEVLRKDKIIIERALHFHGGSDHVDIELVNYAVAGKFKEGKRWPVTCFTCDKKEDVLTRIAVCKSIIKSSKEIFAERKRLDEFLPLLEGAIVFCDKDGTIIEILEVNTEIPAILEHIQSSSWREWLDSHV